MGTTGRYRPTSPEIAVDVRANLAREDKTYAIRLLMDGIIRLHCAKDQGQLQEAIAEEPNTAGDARWGRRHRRGRTRSPWTRSGGSSPTPRPSVHRHGALSC